MAFKTWQKRLDQHFGALAKRRAKTEWPVFGLEHGFTAEEVAQLELDVRHSILREGPSTAEDLPWIVYAAEFGYEYAGDEYWQTFEEKTPGWLRNCERGWMRDAFRRFHSRFGGAEPEGAWADHFSIIAWPITHGILPRDLQRRLVQLLYESRYSFDADVFESAEALGRHLRSLSQGSSSRFRQFAENELLLGQIAAALLIEEKKGSEPLILPATLNRIVTDINRHRTAEDQLSEARSYARRLRVRGLASRRARPPSPATQVLATPTTRPRSGLAVEPRVLLQPATATAWDVHVELPDLTPLLRIHPQLREFLENERGVVCLRGARPLARGQLLYGFHRLVVRAWPPPGTVLLKYDNAPPALRFFLSTAFHMPPGPPWLFKIQADGRAYHLKHRVVHPASSYVVLSQNRTERPPPSLHAVEILCEGVYGLRLEVPETLTEGTRGLLEALGLEASKTMRVWPAGGPPAAWDDEGQAEWLLGDEVVLGLATDPSVSHLWLALDEQDGQVLPARALGGDVPTFVSVGEVSEGLHRLEVRAIPGQDMDENLGGFLEFVVRAPQNWTPGVSDRAPVSFFVEPRAPSLEELWEGKMQLEVSGPRGHTVHSKISLMAKGNEETLYAKRLPSLDLPVTTGTWLAAFRDHFIQDSASEGAYDLAYICKVDLDAGPLGRFSLACERAFTPLRWQVKATSGHMSVRLIDDVGSQTSDIRRYSFSSPDRYEELDYDAVTGGLAVDQPGGLYSARSERSEAGIVVAPRRAMRSFGDLRIDPVVGSFPRLRANVEEALALAERWKKARLTGVMLARIFRDAVLCTLSSNLFSVICSDSWAAAESSFHKDGKPGMMKAQIAKHPSQKFVATAIELDARSLSDSSVMLRVQRFAHWIRGARVSTAGEKHPQAAVGRFPDGTSDEGLPWTCEFALRMASDPGGVSGWAGARLDLGVDALLAYPFIARAARFLVLSVARSTGDSSQSMSLYRGWEW